VSTSQGPVGDAGQFLAGFALTTSSKVDGLREHDTRTGRARIAQYRARLLVTDGLAVATVAIGAIVLLRFHEQLLPFVVIANVTLYLALAVNRTRGRRIVGAGTREFTRVTVAIIFTFGLLAICIVVADAKDVRPLFSTLLPVDAAALFLGRVGWRVWFTQGSTPASHLFRTLIVGPELEVVALAQRFSTDRQARYDVVGFAVDEPATEGIELGGRTIPTFPVLDTIGAIVGATRADLVIVAGQRAADQEFVRELSWSLERSSVDLALASGLDNVADARIHVESVAGVPLMHVAIPTFEGAKHVVKRAFDIALVGMGLLLLAPLFAVIAVAVKLDSHGSVLFRQERVGRNGQTFRMLKFRSMVATAETDLHALLEHNEGSGVLFKLKNDPRVTAVGGFLRKYSLDELPQLWNILVGDMSIVGPRPPLPREVSQYEAHVNRRLYIKPGLTGLWQVSGRSDLSWDQSVRLDLYYVANWSLAGDLHIMWRTVKVVLSPTGAY
jgi:exopolysaccharide biosynthesis polyprenyl glycosylphosphotransferase